MAIKEVKKDSKVPADGKPKMNFAFGKKNYLLLMIGVFTLIIGFITLSGGGSTDPNVFSEELFSPRRMVTAPLLLIIGYGIVAYAIMLRPNAEEGEAQQ